MTAAVRLPRECPLGFPIARLLPHFLVGTLARPAEEAVGATTPTVTASHAPAVRTD